MNRRFAILASLGLVLAIAGTVPAGVVIMQTNEPGYSETGGGWGGGVNPGDERWTNVDGDSSTYAFTGLATGRYWVSAHYFGGGNRVSEGPYEIVGSPTTRVIAQKITPYQFEADGDWWFDLGGPVEVTDGTLTVNHLSIGLDGLFSVDERIRLETVDPFLGDVWISDNGYTGFAQTDGWVREEGDTLGAGSSFGGETAWVEAGDGSETTTWTFDDLLDGEYRVSATWRTQWNLATDAPYTVDFGAGTETHRLNQQSGPGATPGATWFTERNVAWEDIGPDGGVYSVTGGTLSVTLSNDANWFLFGDAVRVERMADLLVWDGQGNGKWSDVPGWETQSGAAAGTSPDASYRARIDANTVTVDGVREAVDLQVTANGALNIDPNRSLTVGRTLDVEPGASLGLLGAGATLIARRGGSISQLDTASGAVVNTGGTLPVAKLTAAGTLIKRGQGVLSLLSGVGDSFTATGATLRIEEGTLLSRGPDPLGGATNVELAGGALSIGDAGLLWGASAVYSFGNSADPGYDASGNGHQGTLVDASWTPDGKLGGAFVSDPLMGRMLLDSVVDIGDEWTVAAWYKGMSEVAGFRTLTRGTADHHLLVVPEGDLGTWDNSTGTLFHDSGFDVAGLDNSIWHHAVAVGSGTSTDYYIDGVLVGTADFKTTVNVAFINNIAGGGQQFADFLDEVIVFGHAMTEAEITTLFNATSYGGSPVMDSTNVAVSADSTLISSSAVAVTFNQLTIGSARLTTAGAGSGINFKTTTIDAGATAVTFDVQAATDLGTITNNSAESPLPITKAGGAALVLDTPIAGSTDNIEWYVEAGTLVAVEAAPLAGRPVTLSGAGAELRLASATTGGTPQFDNAITLAADGALTAGGAGASGPATVTVGGRITVGENTLTLGSLDGYTLQINEAVNASTGNVTIEQGTIELTGAGGQIGTMEIGDAVVSAAVGAVAITDTLKFGDLQFTIDAGNTFGVNGTDLASETASRNVTLSGGTLSLVGQSDVAVAASIGVNFVGTGSVLAGDEIAGFPNVAQGNWNNLSGATELAPQALNDNNDDFTTVTVTWDSEGVWDQGASATPDEKLFHGVIFRNGVPGVPGGTIGVDVTGIPYDTYDVYAYITAYVGDRGGSVNIGDTTYLFKGSHPFTGYVETTETADFAAAPAANYAVFKGLTGDSFTLTQTIENTQVVLTGLQIVQPGLPLALELPNTNLTVTGDATVVSASAEVELGDLTVLPGAANVNLSGAAYSVNNATIADGVTLDGEMDVRGELSIGDGIGAMTIGDGELVLGANATFNVQVSLAGEEAPADKITVSGAAALQLGGTLAVAGVDRGAADFWANASRTIVDNTAGGAIGDVPSDSGFVFDHVTPDPADDAISHHVGQGAFLREIEYVKAPVGPTTFSVNAKLFIALGGDADGDGKVWLSDWAALRANFGNTAADKTWTEGNFDPWQDDKVWLSDWAALRANFGNSDYTTAGATAVPEPATIAMLLAGLAGLAVLGGRRR